VCALFFIVVNGSFQTHRLFSLSEFIEQPELIQAKVPILKFRDTRFCLEVDLNCNNAVGIRNTHLLYCYSQSELLVRGLNVISLFWAITFIFILINSRMCS